MSEDYKPEIEGKKGEILAETIDNVRELWQLTSDYLGMGKPLPINIVSIVCGELMQDLKELEEEILKEQP